MNTKLRLLVMNIIICISISANIAFSADVDFEGVTSGDMDEIIVDSLLADYSWDQAWLLDAASSDIRIRYYNQFMDFYGKVYPVGCTAVVLGQVIHYQFSELINKPSSFWDPFLINSDNIKIIHWSIRTKLSWRWYLFWV
jgi:hypothetical protein